VSAEPESRAGLGVGFGAYFIWGLFPIYIKLLVGVPAADVLAHRILWSAALLVLLVTATRRWREVVRALATPSTRWMLVGSAFFIGVNWLIYTWAVLNEHVLDTSLGYFINPLISVLFGTWLLGERLSRPQWAAVALAATGVAVVTVARGTLPLVSLALAFSFATYGLLRKRAPVDAVSGLFAETLLLLPLVGLWLAVNGTVFGASPRTDMLLMLGGIATTIPLLMFGWAARKLRLSTIGLLQYVAPSMVFLLAVFVYREPLSMPQLAAFALIWTGLALYVADGWRRTRVGAAA
jgi:chloramphenicol-sensitive protein RarD